MDLAFFLLVVASLGALLGTFAIMARAARAYGARASKRKAGPRTRACPVCKAKMQLVGVDHLMAGGPASTNGEGSAHPAGIPGAGLPVEVYACTICQRVDLALAPAAMAELAPAPGARAAAE